MEQLAVDRLFQDMLIRRLKGRPGVAAPLQVVGTLPVETRQELSAALLELLQTELPTEALELTELSGRSLERGELDAAIMKLRQCGAIQRIVFLRIKDAVADAVLPLIGFGYIAMTDDPTAAVLPFSQVLKVLWDKLVVLKRDNDAAAIDTYEALTVAIAAGRATNAGLPTTTALHAHLPNMTVDVLKAALKRLADLQLIEVATWGTVPGDLADEGNAWRARL